MRKAKLIKYTILLICEGKNTEPLYFSSIRKVIHEKELWPQGFNMIIIPKPTDEENESQPLTPSHKTVRPSRELKKTEKRIDVEVDSKFIALPVKYVREAQLEMADKSYDECWAVFDHDSRDEVHIKHAFELSQDSNQGLVGIAFSNKAFEHWCLLHFEQSTTVFQKSECREGKDPLECGSGLHPNDCYGGSCIGGYLRTMGYMKTSTKVPVSCFPTLSTRLEQAYINAAWLRFYMQSTLPEDTPIYNINPYTNVDILVKKLLADNRIHTWNRLNANIIIEGLSLVVSNTEGMIQVHNTGNAAFIMPKNSYILNTHFESIYSIPNTHIEPGNKISISLTGLDDPQYFSIQVNNTLLFIKL
jgi:hypothetical protein